MLIRGYSYQSKLLARLTSPNTTLSIITHRAAAPMDRFGTLFAEKKKFYLKNTNAPPPPSSNVVKNFLISKPKRKYSKWKFQSRGDKL